MAKSKAGQTLTLKTAAGEAFVGYVAGSENAKRGILILHEWWGLKPHNKLWADQFAKAGYRALVIDLFDGRVTDHPEEAGKWMHGLDPATVDAKLLAALEYLDSAKRKLATYGCSMGGRHALHAAILFPQMVSAMVALYSRMETHVGKLKTLKGPVLAIYAEQERSWPDKQEDFEVAMDAAGKVTESLSFDAAHGFTNPESEHYDEVADMQAWEATLAFLDKHL